MIDITTLENPSPDELLRLPLEVGLWQNNLESGLIANHAFSELTSWKTYWFESSSHMLDRLEHLSLHILMTHCHDENNNDHSIDHCADRLRVSRGSPGVGTGPLLVGTAVRFGEELLSLKKRYDLVVIIPYDAFELANEVAQCLWSLLPKRCGL